MHIFNVCMHIQRDGHTHREREVKDRYTLSKIKQHVPELQTASVQSANPTEEHDNNGQFHHYYV